MAKKQGDIRYLQGIFDSTTRQFLGISDPSSPGDGVDFDVPVYSDAQVEAGATGVVASTASGLASMPDGSLAVLTRNQSAAADMQMLPQGASQALGTNAGNGFISNSQLPAFAKFYGVKLIYLNYNTAATQTMDGAKVAACPVTTTVGNNDGRLAWSNFVTFNGAQTATIPQAVTGAGGQTIPGILISDFMPITSVARTDVVGAPYLLRVASHFADSSVLPSFNGTNYGNLDALAANPGFRVATYTSAGTLANLVSTSASTLEGGGVQSPIAAIFYYDKNVTSLLAFGDSIFQGQGTTTTYTGVSVYLNFQAYAQGINLASSNTAASGQATVDTLSVLSSTIPSVKPTFALIKPLSPNDGTTQAAADKSWAYFVQMLEVCRVNGVVPVACTTPMWSGANNAIVAAQNAKLMGLGSNVIKIDLYSLITPNGIWNPAYNSGDSVHPNDAGTLAAANLVLSAISNLNP